MPSPTHALTPSTPAAPSFAAAPQSMNAFLPMMMFMGRRRGGRGGGGGYSSGAYDPYECSATCAAQQGYCGKPEASLLQLTESAPAVMPLVAPLGALPSVPPLRADDAGARADGARARADAAGRLVVLDDVPDDDDDGGQEAAEQLVRLEPDADELHPDVPGQPRLRAAARGRRGWGWW